MSELKDSFFVFKEDGEYVYYYAKSRTMNRVESTIHEGIRVTSTSIELVKSKDMSNSDCIGCISFDEFIKEIETAMGHIKVEFKCLMHRKEHEQN